MVTAALAMVLSGYLVERSDAARPGQGTAACATSVTRRASQVPGALEPRQRHRD